MAQRVRIFLTLILLVCLLALASRMAAQVITATIRGRVVDAQGAVLTSAKITARQTETNATSSVVTGELGQYYLPSLPAGKYEITVEARGFAPMRRTIELTVGLDVTLDFALQVGGLNTTVEVSGEAPLVETTKAEVGETIRKEQIDNLPTVNRDFASLALLVPGVSSGVGGNGTSLAINAQRGYQNNVFVDGASNQWQYYGRQASTFSQDWIQEFQVMTNSYSAEFGQASGGIMNVLTRGGTNSFHGRGYGFFQRKSLDSPPFAGYFTNNDINRPVFLNKDEMPNYIQRRWGGYVGGPLVKDRIFFFTGYEDLNRGSSDSLAISDYWKAQGYASVLPIKTTDHPFIVKGDFNLSARNRMSLRWDRTINKNINEGDPWTVEPGRDTFGGPVWNLVGNFTTTINNTSFNEFRGYYMSNMPPIICNMSGTGGMGNLEKGPPGTFSRQEYPTMYTGCPIFTGTEGEQNLGLSDNYALVRGKHQLKFGGQAIRNNLNDDITNFHDGYWAFQQDAVFNRADPNTYPYYFIGNVGPGKFSVPIWNYGFFVQDTWQLKENFTLNLGLRYDVDRSATAGDQWVDQKNASIVSRFGGGPVLQRTQVDYNNFAPRIGFAWSPTADRKTSIRGAAGMFFDQNHGNFNAIYIINSLLSNGLTVIDATDPITNPFWNDADPVGSENACKAWFAQNFPFFPDLSLVAGPTQGLDAIDPHLQVPFTAQFSGGVTHEFPFGLTLLADFVHSRGSGLEYMDKNSRLLPDGSVESIDPRFTYISWLSNVGYTHYTALQMQAVYRKKAVNLGLSYTLSKAMSNLVSGSVFGSSPTNPFNLNEDNGPDATDQRHNLVLNGTYQLPLGFQFAGILTFRSPRPWSVWTANNPTHEAYPPRPEPKGSRRGDTNKGLDFRFGKTFKFRERLSTSFFWEMFNAFNWTNWTSFDAQLESSNFGLPAAAGSMRKQQFGFRIDF